jgi:hypothetical protein
MSDEPELPGADVEAIRSRHEQELLRFPHVVGVATGMRTREGRPTGEPAILVFVDRKVARSELAREDVLPRELDGVPVDVVEAGAVRPLDA